MPLLEAHNLHKSYGSLPVLQGVSLSLEAGEFVSLVGQSGAGKSTLLQVLGTLDAPDAGTLRFEGQNLLALSAKQSARFRNRSLGFIFQFHHLFDEFTALENVCMPAFVQGQHGPAVRQRAQQLLTELGLAQRLQHKPTELSGGEQQRVAVARALMNEPQLILADEPTGNLDSANSTALFELFLELSQQKGIAFLVATHNDSFAAATSRCLRIRDGVIVAETLPTPPVTPLPE
jgi:lipoprotein-releasing system ATP-binding protein